MAGAHDCGLIPGGRRFGSDVVLKVLPDQEGTPVLLVQCLPSMVPGRGQKAFPFTQTMELHRRLEQEYSDLARVSILSDCGRPAYTAGEDSLQDLIANLVAPVRPATRWRLQRTGHEVLAIGVGVSAVARQRSAHLATLTTLRAWPPGLGLSLPKAIDQGSPLWRIWRWIDEAAAWARLWQSPTQLNPDCPPYLDTRVLPRRLSLDAPHPPGMVHRGLLSTRDSGMGEHREGSGGSGTGHPGPVGRAEVRRRSRSAPYRQRVAALFADLQ